MKPINAQTLPLFAGCSGDVCSRPIRGIVVDFHGLGFQDMPQEPSAFARRCAEKGLLYLLPYDNPWSWMNDTAVRMVDEMVEAAREKYALPDDIPVVACGGSMGGLSCLIYTGPNARRRPARRTARYAICLIIIPSARTCPVPSIRRLPTIPATLWKRSKPRPHCIRRRICRISPI